VRAKPAFASGLDSSIYRGDTHMGSPRIRAKLAAAIAVASDLPAGQPGEETVDAKKAATR